jgi:hypothetical protein
MHNTKGVDLKVESVKLGEGKLKADAYPIAHLTGTGKFKLSDAARAELKAYVEKGGTLVVDAAGGSSDFKDAAQAELTTILGAAAANGLANALPPTHPLYTGGGATAAKVSYRPYARRLLVGGINVPRLRGVEINNRLAVIYSPEDLSVGLVGMAIDGIYGYDPASANELMERIVMSVVPKAVTGSAAGATQPKPAATEKPMPVEDKKPVAVPPKSPQAKK